MPETINARSARLNNTKAIPLDFPHPNRLGDKRLFIAVLGGVGSSTFERWLADGILPRPAKFGGLNRWRETDMAEAVAARLRESA